MKKFLLSIISAVSAWAATSTVPVEFTSLSVQILPATAEDGIGFDWSSGLSGVGSVDSVNHELKLATEDHGFSHEGFFVFENGFEFEPFLVPFILDVPPFADANDNGIDDFYDASLPVDGIRTDGRHPDGANRPTSFNATWTRAAGDSMGSVVIALPSLGVTFQHTFQLLRYTGEFSFERMTNFLEGIISLTNVFEAQDVIRGPLSIDILATNTLKYNASTWTNGGGAVFTVDTNLDLGINRTNFVSYWLLEDGYAPTAELDYADWILVISSADANGNGQLDLTEGFSTPGERPRLGLVRLPNGSLEVTVQGTPGQTYVLESANTVDSLTWQTSQTVTLTGSTQSITVSGAGTRRFFRLRQ